MPSFLEDISAFYGTGEKNAAGQTLEEFLETYDPYRYKNPCCTTDAVVFSAGKELYPDLDGLKVLLVRRSNHPSIGYWALPGGFVNLRENLEVTARRELEEETGVSGIAVEQFACYGDYDRDPRARVITTAYMALVDEDQITVQAGDDAADAAWCTVSLEETGKKTEDGWFFVDYRIMLANDEKGIYTTAAVRKKERTGLIREKKYEVAERGITAVDHAAIIVQAMEILRSRLRHVK
ncbi:MAG TPA: NUDIX hydrolase [Candidatus Mediterraneibacter norfolkensis]|nr:NUDIX hydrolase [Candidatus Mediterraneibacter norfolkensis]